MSRPGVKKVLDPTLASLLAIGDQVTPSVPPALNFLHVALKLAVAEKPPEETLPDSDDSGSEDVVSDPEEVVEQEERFEQRFRVHKRKEGLKSDRTLKAAFKLMDCLIGQYKLNRTDEILRELAPACKARAGDWHVKYIQSTAFVRWKQYKFKEALELFLEQQTIVGVSAALCENIGHTYSSMGDLTKAEEYFERAIELLKRGSYGNRGGIYMGLGLVRDRLGKTKEALPILEQASRPSSSACRSTHPTRSPRPHPRPEPLPEPPSLTRMSRLSSTTRRSTPRTSGSWTRRSSPRRTCRSARRTRSSGSRGRRART